MSVREAGSVQERVERLLRDGLDHYAMNRVNDALQCWNQVLAVHPGHPRALDYLADALGTGPSAPSGLLTSIVIDGAESNGRNGSAHEHDGHELPLDERLGQLLRLHALRPSDESISRQVQSIKGKLIREYLVRLGSLDRVPQLVDVDRAQPLPSDMWGLVDLIDGIASLDDILATSRLGTFRGLRYLVLLVDAGAIRFVLPHVTATAFAVTPSSSSEVPVVAPPGDGKDFEALFERATRAYLRRDFSLAETLFDACLAIRPGDGRARHNLERLRRRTPKDSQ